MKVIKEISATKEKILEAAKQLMLKQGFPATTVDEICDASGFTKGSFFHYFESKEELGKAVLEFYSNKMSEMIEMAPFNQEFDPLQRVYGYLDFLIQLSKHPEAPKSCILGNFTQELAETHAEIRSLCAARFDQWANRFKRDLDQAKDLHAHKAPFDTLSLAEHLISLVEGSFILAKAKKDNGIFERNILQYKLYLKCLFEKKYPDGSFLK
ncbi:MAG: TetR/AcrR family transcriptional regulator [Nitrospirae bacterium]|nr:TetR/AcrR family transcriptional regulator [Nitrospirota bacterium]